MDLVLNMVMQAPYLTLDFSLSQAAWSWVQSTIEPVIQRYQATAPLDGALVNLDNEQRKVWHSSQAWAEIRALTDQFGLGEPRLQFFIYKRRPPLEDPRGNPHIDTTGPNEQSTHVQDIPIRFNLLLRGETNQRMSWWNKDRNDPDVVTATFQRPDGASVRRLQARGANKKQQYAAIGEPQWHCDSLSEINRRASFVRTDILHALDWTAQEPRFVLSARFTEPWIMIEQHRPRFSG